MEVENQMERKVIDLSIWSNGQKGQKGQYKGKKDAIDRMKGHEHLLILSNPCETNQETSKLLKKDSIEYYHLCISQVTIQPEDPNVPLKNILSDYGLMVYDYACNLAKQPPKDEFTEYTLDRINSGSWFAEKESKYYNPDEPGGFFNSFNNVVVIGKTLKTEEKSFTKTSPCLFVNTKEGWVYTKSGSLYKLSGKEYDYLEWTEKY